MVIFFIVLVVLLLDQLSKWLMRSHFSLGESYDIISNVFSLTYIENKGAAFGLGEGNAYLFIAIAILVSAGLLYYYKKSKKTLVLSFAIGFLLAGAWGNLIDRAMKASVTDMFDFHIWPVFNVADIAVCLGAGLFIWHIFKEHD